MPFVVFEYLLGLVSEFEWSSDRTIQKELKTRFIKSQ